MKKKYTIAEAASRLKVSYQRVGQLIKEGRLKAYRPRPEKRDVRIKESELRRYEEWRALPFNDRIRSAK